MVKRSVRGGQRCGQSHIMIMLFSLIELIKIKYKESGNREKVHND